LIWLAVSGPAAQSRAGRKRAVARVVQEVADYLGNTPAVARASYIDPRIITLYGEGATIALVLADLGKGQAVGDVATKGHAERAVLKLLLLTGPGSAHSWRRTPASCSACWTWRAKLPSSEVRARPRRPSGRSSRWLPASRSSARPP
jgi:hypothetical protein